MGTIIFGGVAAVFVAMTISALMQLRFALRLPALEMLPADPAAPARRCSIVIAARDEADRVEQTVRRLLAQTGVSVEVIVVDDRSTDGTGARLARLGENEPRLRVARIDTLPEGWLGKCHACHIGANMATSDWILFTDADCWLTPDLIARALRVADKESADHITLLAGTELESLATRAWYLLFVISLLGWMRGVNEDRPKSYLGIGAFNLIRAAAYRECGGYEALRLTVVDDVKMGLLLRRAGKRTRAFLGAKDVQCHWGKTLRDMVQVMEKNYFAVLDYRVEVAVAGTAAVLAVLGIIVAGVATGTPLGIVAALSPLGLIVPGTILARRMEWSAVSAMGVPFVIPVFLYALLNSTVVTLRQGGVRWRETFYSLEQLRAGGVR